jgi:pimeloyl-ACP methyl ester carboxylesterase
MPLQAVNDEEATETEKGDEVMTGKISDRAGVRLWHAGFSIALISTMALLTSCADTGALQTQTVAYDPILNDPVSVDPDFPPSIVELNFESYDDRLNGNIYLADGVGPHPTVVLLHGYPGNEKNLDLAQSLRRDGFNVLFFHYRGAWGSVGEFSFTHVIEDVKSASDMLRERAADYRVDPDHLILVGHSMGGFAALQGAANDPDIACVAGIAPADFGMIGQAPDEALEGFAGYSDTLQMLSGWTGEKAMAELKANAESFALAGLSDMLSGKSVLLIAGDKDESVSVDMVQSAGQAYAENPDIGLRLEVLSGDHSFSWSRMALSEVVLDWIDACR